MWRQLVDKVSPRWTASQNDLRQPTTAVLGLLIAVLPLILLPGSTYAARGENAPLVIAMATLLVCLVLVPGLAFLQRTEVLYDGMHVALRILGLGFLLFIAAFWLAPAESPLQSTPQLAAFLVTVSALYAALVLGLVWAIQFARKGTSGIDTELQ